ncbi:MAG: hypothetical protein ABIK09_08905 [Pseudomonadota bacterium]
MRTLYIALVSLVLTACGGDPSNTQPGEDTPHFPGLDIVSDLGEFDGSLLDPDTGGDGVPATPGDLQVEFAYNGAVPVQMVSISLMETTTSCDGFDPTAPWTDGIAVQKAVPSLDSVVIFEHLEVETTYTIFATALGPGDKLAAAGCMDGIQILPGEMGATEVTLEIYLLLLDARGAYTVTHDLDLDGATFAPADAVLAEVGTLYSDPAGALYEKVRTIALVNSGLEEAAPAFVAFSSSLQNAINGWFAAETPGYLDALLTAGAGLGAALDAVILTAELDLGGTAGDIQLSGSWAWKDLSVRWPGGCTPGNAGCETLHFGPTDLVASDYPVYLSTDLFSASVANFDQLTIEKHGLSLSLGALALHLLHEVLLPGVGGPADILTLTTEFADCAGITASMIPSAITGIGLDAEIIEGMCQSAVNSLVGDLEDAVEDLLLESELKVKGTCVLVDTDDDLEVDALADGQWDGDVIVDDEEAAPIQGTFQSN